MNAPNPIAPAQLLVDAREAARLLSISPRTLWSLTACGAVAHVRIGRAVRYALADLESYVAKQRQGATA